MKTRYKPTPEEAVVLKKDGGKFASAAQECPVCKCEHGKHSLVVGFDDIIYRCDGTFWKV